MFEFETGAPPFSGKTVPDIARQHIQAQPPRLGGWFKRTDLGLEKVIARCLEKQPADRYSTYEELDEVLVGIAGRLGASLDRCTATTRYERAQLGEGHLNQNIILNRASVTSAGDLAILEASDIEPFLEEATNLIALSRYVEAEQLLRPHFSPELLSTSEHWLPIHTIALNYALCQVKTGRLDDALATLRLLETPQNRPAEFYVNFSLALLHTLKWMEAAELCKRGLHSFHNDLDIQGNLTISLMNCGDLDGAAASAIRRLKLRRDIHGIEEAAGVLQRQARAKRNVDLPEAASIAKIAGDLVKEGNALNPRLYSLRLKEIQLRRFAHDEHKVVGLCQELIDADDCPTAIRQMAFAEMVEKLSEGKSFTSALDLIQRSGSGESERLLAVKMRTLAHHFMIGKENAAGQRVVIPEVRDYFLGGSSTQLHHDPVIAAEILEWMSDARSALAILKQHLSAVPDDWEGVRIMALIHLRMGKHDSALHFAQSLTTVAPWRTESYDWLSYVSLQINRPEIARQAKRRGDEAFERESAIFDDLRAHLDA